jgi:uncharacterized protein (TIGR00255 family)
MKSMTGFSEASLNKDGIQFKCFVKSLNSRFIEVNIKLPNNLKKHEGWIRDLIKKSFARGKIDMDLHYTSPPKEHLKVSDNFIKLVKQNEKNAKSKGLDLVGASYLDLVRLRDSIQSDYVLSETALKTLIKKSLAKLAKTREAEGKTTNADMKRLSSKMQKSLNKIKRMEKQNTQHMQKKFKRIKAELKLSNKEINMNEVFSSFSKADINEEVVRFQSHLDLVIKLMKSKDLIGKKLDFYTQEMLRETNTLSSKALIAEIKNEAVELKSLIEKMKEHAQNVE